MTMLAMILPGVAVTYYGEEIGMVDNTNISWNDTKDPQACKAGIEKFQNRSRDPARTPFQWNWSRNAGTMIFTRAFSLEQSLNSPLCCKFPNYTHMEKKKKDLKISMF